MHHAAALFNLPLLFLIACSSPDELAKNNNPARPRDRTLSPIPLQVGTKWLYNARAEFISHGAVLTTNFPWTMEVTEVFTNRAGLAAIIRGFPSELACYEPGRMPGLSVIFTQNSHAYRFNAPSDAEARSLAETLSNGTRTISSSDELWLTLPLEEGKRWAHGPARDDFLYCWYVSEEKSTPDAIGDSQPSDHRIWTTIYRTLPDHQVFDLTQGIGITKYIYVHHGTPASVEAKLKAFIPP